MKPRAPCRTLGVAPAISSYLPRSLTAENLCRCVNSLLLIICVEQCVSKGLAPSLHLKKEGNDDQRVAASPEIGNVTPNLWMDLILQQGRSEAFLEQFTPTARGAPLLSASCPTLPHSLVQLRLALSTSDGDYDAAERGHFALDS